MYVYVISLLAGVFYRLPLGLGRIHPEARLSIRRNGRSVKQETCHLRY